MAHYIGKFESQLYVQQALDQGKLAKPYVAQYGNENDGIYLDYNSLETIEAGSDTLGGTIDFVSGEASTPFQIQADGLYWQIEFGSFAYSDEQQGYGNAYPTLYVQQNTSEDSRSTEFTVVFYYDSQFLVERNRVVTTINQEGVVIEDGFIEPTSLNRGYNAGNTYCTVYGENLYWRIEYNVEWLRPTRIEGYGSGSVAFYCVRNDAAVRETTFTVNFYKDPERTVLKNSVTGQVTQTGRNKVVPSFNPDYYIKDKTVGYESGTTSVYIVNDQVGYYVVVHNPFTGEEYSGSSQNVFNIEYPENTNYAPQYYQIQVDFYTDSEYTHQERVEWLNFNQDGNTSMPYAYWNDTSEVPQSGATRDFVVNLGTAAYPDTWRVEIPNDGSMSFTDYPGVYSVSGVTSEDSVSITINANTTFAARDCRVTARFYRSGAEVSYYGDGLYQGGVNPGDAVLAGSNEPEYSVKYNWTGDVVADITVTTGAYFALLSEGEYEVLITSGSTSESVTATTIASANTSSDDIVHSFSVNYYSDPDLSDEHCVKQVPLTFVQRAYAPVTSYECVYMTSADNQTVNISSGEGYFEFSGAYCDGADIRDSISFDGDSHFQYTIPSAGTHTIVLERENDPYLQGWLQNTDMVSFYGHSDNVSWGFWSDVFNGSNSLTAITLDANCAQFEQPTFSDLTGVTVFNCYMADGNSVYPGSDPITGLSGSTGTLHIPSGATSNYSNIITGLGSNWTVVDDL